MNILDDIKNMKKQNDRNKIFSQYPCEVYLHNALSFLDDDKPEEAYEEICHALVKSGALLTDDEKQRFDTIMSRYFLNSDN